MMTKTKRKKTGGRKDRKKASAKSVTKEILCAGFGGQGIMFMGKLIAQAGLDSEKHVTWMPSYGAEVRGGTAYSMTKISDKEIPSPIVMSPDILVVMNEPSLIKYESKLKTGGMIILNRSLIEKRPNRKDITILNIPMTEIASRIGDVRCANMVAIGALTKRLKAFAIRAVTNALKDMLKGKEELFQKNKDALERGYKLA